MVPLTDLYVGLVKAPVFGAIIAIGGFFINGAVGWGAGGIGKVLARDLRVERALRWASASVFGLLAAKLAWDSRA